MSRTVIAIAACAIALVACRRNQDNTHGSTNVQPLGKSIGSVAGTPGEPGTNCPAGFTGHTAPAWCIALPKGYRFIQQFDDGNDTGHVDYSPSPLITLRVFFTRAPFEAVVQMARIYMQAFNWNATGEGEFASGHWLSGNDQDGQSHFVSVAHARPTFTIRCDARADVGSEDFRRTADACNSLLVP
jgi:hypothetical protein